MQARMAKKKYGIQKSVGRFKHITGKSYDMYYTRDLVVGCQKVSPKGKWILDKKVRGKGAFKLASFKTRNQCTIALKKELGI